MFFLTKVLFYDTKKENIKIKKDNQTYIPFGK